MSEVLLRIHEDHANTLRLLGLLAHQTAVIEAGKRPDWEIVRNIVDYFLTYPDLRHHPIEDQVLVLLQRKDAVTAERFADLPEEHRRLGVQLRHLAAVTESLLQDEPTAKAEYTNLLRAFVTAQREHLHREEAAFLPTARRVLGAEDWTALDLHTPRVADPVQDATDERFQHLRWRLAEWDKESQDGQAPAKG